MTIELPCFDIIVELHGDGGGVIVASGLKEKCCHPQGMTLHPPKVGCEGTCVDIYNGAMDGIESLILAHACAGIDITSPKYVEGIKTAVEACGNNL